MNKCSYSWYVTRGDIYFVEHGNHAWWAYDHFEIQAKNEQKQSWMSRVAVLFWLLYVPWPDFFRMFTRSLLFDWISWERERDIRGPKWHPWPGNPVIDFFLMWNFWRENRLEMASCQMPLSHLMTFLRYSMTFRSYHLNWVKVHIWYNQT